MTRKQTINRALFLVAAIAVITVESSYLQADTGTCGGASITLSTTTIIIGLLLLLLIVVAVN